MNNSFDLIPKPASLKVLSGTCDTAAAVIRKNQPELSAEAYRLHIQPNEITIEAGSETGFFYAEQTLAQLRFLNRKALPCVEIEDAPVCPYRSYHIDTARHMISIDELKRMADAAAAFKLNRFHWHFSDDQGWRLESNVFPLLHEIGAARKGDHFGAFNSDTAEHEYYTQEEIRDLVAYCAERHIEIVPEIDIPGHVTAILAAYPHLSCTGKTVEVADCSGIFPEILCPGKEETFDFLFTLIDELCELFPGTCFHIGGDETPKTRWTACPCCQKRMQEEHLTDTRQLQGYLANRAAAYLQKKGKTVIAWNEAALGGNLNPSIVLQLWNDDPKDPALKALGGQKDENGKLTGPNQGIGRKHIDRGGNVIVSNMMGSYCDYPYAFISMKKIYEAPILPQKCEDIPEKVKAQTNGVEVLCWTEYIRTEKELEHQVWPRFAAKAETGWSGNDAGSYKNFAKRMKTLFPFLKNLVPFAASSKYWTPGPLLAAKEMLGFARNISRQTRSGYAQAQQEI